MAPDEAVVDVGLETFLAYREVLAEAATVIWNGTLGVADRDATRVGTQRITQAFSIFTRRSLIFGGRTVAQADLLDALGSFKLVSRSGAGALPLMSGFVLPGVESLRS